MVFCLPHQQCQHISQVICILICYRSNRANNRMKGGVLVYVREATETGWSVLGYSFLQLAQNIAAKLITRKKKFDHVTPLLEELHWLPVEYRMIFKMMLICFKALHGTGPLYIKDMLTFAKPKGGYNFQWSKDTLLLEQPSTRLVAYGDRQILQWILQCCSFQTLEQVAFQYPRICHCIHLYNLS